MPIGKPTAQTKASAKYQEKIGLISKSYKLKKEVVDKFAETCLKNGVPQSVQISKMMMDYIEQNN